MSGIDAGQRGIRAWGVSGWPPDSTPAAFSRAAAAHAAGRLDEAAEGYSQVLAERPTHAESLQRLGAIALQLGNASDALELIDAAIALGGIEASWHSNRGLALRELRRLDEALAACDQSLALKRRNPEAWHNRAIVLNELSRHGEAVAAFNRVLAIDPAAGPARWGKAMTHLLMGNLAAGWDLFDARWRSNECDSVPRVTERPAWRQGKAPGRQLLWQEQGVGDAILFASLLPQWHARVPDLRVEVDARLVPLFRRSMPTIAWAGVGTTSDDAFDSHLSLAELPRHLRRNLEDFAGRQQPWLVPDSNRVGMLRAALAPAGERVIGISWRTANKRKAFERNVPLVDLARALVTEGVRLVSLQYGHTEDERAALRRDADIDVQSAPGVDPWADLDGLAALIGACDLVVSIDNSTVHMAGAIGKPTWVLLPKVPEWRWMLDRADSPWYPSVRLWRQAERGRWADVLARARAALLAETSIARAISLHRAGRIEEAAAAYQARLALVPDDASALHLLGVIACQRKQFDEAIALMGRAIVIEPHEASFQSNLGVALWQRRHLELALAAHERALEIDPGHAQAWYNRGLVLADLGRHAEGMTSLQGALLVQPDYPKVHWARARALLLQGDVHAGWSLYHWRWAAGANDTVPPQISVPRWAPGMVAGRQLVWAEQGIGDEIFFATMLPAWRERIGAFSATCNPRLVTLFKRSMPRIAWLASDETLDASAFDTQMAMGDVVARLQIEAPGQCHPTGAVLSADAVRVVRLRSSLCKPGERLVGVSWHSVNPTTGRDRSVELLRLAASLSRVGVRVVSLQYGDTGAEIAAVREACGLDVQHCEAVDNAQDLDGLAALIAACDLVVTIDNITAHLAGALGVPVCLMLPRVPDWRWMLEGEATPWYRSMRLLRQRVRGEWTPVLERLHAVVADLAGAAVQPALT